MSLVDVGHQGRAQRWVQRAVQRERVPHAFLFHGPDGVGKEKLARGLAQLLLCGHPVDRTLDAARREAVGLERLRTGCGDCEECRLAAAGTHPDLHLVYRQLGRAHPDPVVRKRKALDIGVDVLRHFMIERVALKPARGRVKVFVVREADRITPQAQNSLLKTLEEPPGETVIILLVAARDRLLPTTLSRCRLVSFDTLPTAFITENLARCVPALSAEQVEWYARTSEGSLGSALQRAEDDWYSLNQRLLAGLTQLTDGLAPAAVRKAGPGSGGHLGSLPKAWIAESKALAEQYRKRDPDITETEAQRRGLKSILQLAAEGYADVLRIASGHQTGVVNRAGVTALADAARSIGPLSAIRAINRLAEAQRQLDLHAHTELCVETLVHDLSRLGTGKRAVV